MKIGEHEIPDEPAARNQWQRGIAYGWNEALFTVFEFVISAAPNGTDMLRKKLEFIPTGKEGGDEQACEPFENAKTLTKNKSSTT